MPDVDGHAAAYQPVLDDGEVLGARCTLCARPVAPVTARCPACGGVMAPERFPGRGAVWASTLIHIRVGDLVPPYALAYVDLDGGPRVLARPRRASSLPVGHRVRLEASAVEGVWAELVDEASR
jgi:uncharacterized OB-fold protein